MNKLFYLENDALRVGISPLGAEMQSIYDKNGGYSVMKSDDDPTWNEYSPILFPVCGRLWEFTTVINDRCYPISIHGFTAGAPFTVAELTSTRAVLSLTDSPELLENTYPFPFLLTITYTLEDNALITEATVENRGAAPMPFTIGFHPGFNLSVGGSRQEDAYLEFPAEADPKAWRLTLSGYLLRGTDPYPLQEGQRIPVRKEMFRGNTCVFLENTAGEVTLCSHSSPRKVRVSYDGFPYLGLWQPEDERASFLCIEPWMGSPDYEGEITPLVEKRDMRMLAPGTSESFSYRITVL